MKNNCLEPPKFIVCPKCGRQYHPAEIYNPTHFLGKPKDIVRDCNGEILGYEGIESDPYETYVCENCDFEMNIKAKISFIITNNATEETIEAPVSRYSLW